MDDDIRAAERLREYALIWLTDGLGDENDKQRWRDEIACANAILDAPRWHDTPPVPGLYVSLNPDGSMSGLLWHVVVTDPDEYRRYCPGRRWWGPIPEKEHTP